MEDWLDAKRSSSEIPTTNKSKQDSRLTAFRTAIDVASACCTY